jgi:peptidyl-prolyl cis-trans isomerase A (cyclophilin A)/peptidyl-prolyl cis-trans isomerase B (cyclophilin B)
MRFLLGIIGLMLWINAQAANPLVEIKTNLGNITFELFPHKAPNTVQNFMRYAKSGFYDGTIFHRVVKGFVVQGGGYTSALRRKPTRAPIRNEAANGLTNAAGTLAMARTRDPNSATSQFFINVDRNLFLNHYSSDPDYYGYCVFGKVVKGMDVVKRIAAVPTTGEGPFASDVPVRPVVIEEVSLLPGKTADQLRQPRKQRKIHG